MPSFFVFVVAFWAAAHAFIFVRLVRPMRLPRRSFGLAVLWLCVSFALPPALFALDLWPDAGPERRLTRGFAWWSMGAFTVLCALVAARDIALAVRAAVRALSRRAGRTVSDVDPGRRTFLMRATGGGVVGTTGLLSGVGLAQARRTAEVTQVEVPIPGLPDALDGYHIVQISDVHVGETIDAGFITPIIERVGALGADLVAVTGDIVDGSVERLRRDVAPLAYLRGRDGVFFVTGNHEYYSGAESWCEHFAGMGMVVLNNAHHLIERGGARLLVGGVTDHREGVKHGQPSSPSAALAGAPDADVRLLLAHQPRSAFDAAAAGFDLQLSGHTHGGQYFPWNLFVGLVQPVARGLAQVDNMWVYVNRGTCYWGPPLRTFVPPEITSLRLRKA